jgi:hypothetical protein
MSAIAQHHEVYFAEAIADQTRALALAIRVAQATSWRYGHHGAFGQAVDEALDIVIEHCLEAARAGQSPCEVLRKTCVRDASLLTTWGDAIARLVADWLTEIWPKLPCEARGGALMPTPR